MQATSRCGGGCSPGDWHYVGDPGEPAFQNGWANVGGAWVPTRFRTECGGFRVQMAVTGGTSHSTIFTLPADIVLLIDYQLPGDGFNEASVFRPWYVTTAGDVTDDA